MASYFLIASSFILEIGVAKSGVKVRLNAAQFRKIDLDNLVKIQIQD
jgi:hypothetical protein